MKKIIMCLIMVMVCCMFAVCIFALKNNNFREIAVEDIFQAAEKNEEIIVYYGQEDCSACNVFSTMLKGIAERSQKKMFYLNADSLSIDEKEILENYYVLETPTLIIVSNGNVFFYRNITTSEEIEKAITNVEITEERINEIKKIEYQELKEKFEGGVDFFLYIGREDCRDCVKFHPILEQYVDENENRGLYYFDIKEYRDLVMVDNASTEDIEFYDELKDEFDIEWVPSVYHIRNNMIIAKYEFLNEEYYLLENDEQEIEEKVFIEEFYYWMEREFKGFRSDGENEL